ncbi:hypothetical protein BDV26DRAFT_274968 [Aspergillus bertholletiae]|uniref:Uncharacterized protein n=1 Tax=Aspergillus bertholletiae TaxID=1226010 RepID=A0A5N7ASK0_9EURO|nr:hypothetical protein BDV26DRAFT_274968 [Aspergillus bertholletiae]
MYDTELVAAERMADPFCSPIQWHPLYLINRALDCPSVAEVWRKGPVMVFLGHLDVMISTHLTRRLAGHCSHSAVVSFYGTPHIPREPKNVQRVVWYILGCVEGPVSLAHES